jgi:hypothetical protein
MHMLILNSDIDPDWKMHGSPLVTMFILHLSFTETVYLDPHNQSGNGVGCCSEGVITSYY